MKMLFTGDISPTAVTAPLFDKQDISALFADSAKIFEGNDFTFVNLECAITESENEIKKYGPHLKAPTHTADVLKSLGVNCAGLSNNHIFDFGKEGIADTLENLKRVGIDYTGFGENYDDARKNYVIENEKICIIAVCEHEYSYALQDRMGSRAYDVYDTHEDIRNAKKDGYKVIVIYHGGKEFCRYPSPRLLKACRAMAKDGADMVLCQHSHCIGAYEKYEGCHILYGQGNFNFAKPHAFDGWYTGLAVKYDTETADIEFIPIEMTESGIALAKGESKDKILSEFRKRCASVSDGSWILGWREFCESVKENYTDKIKNALLPESSEEDNGYIGHYLDCEAHTDVWREIFKTANHTNEK